MKHKTKTTLILIFTVILTCLLIGFAAGYNEGKTTEATETTEATAETTEQPKSLEVVATAYCACVNCCGKSDGITATGTQATAGRTIAVDPSIIPYGTEVTINGHTYIAEDCGGAVKGNKVDIFFNTHEEALNFGKQVMTAFYFE